MRSIRHRFTLLVCGLVFAVTLGYGAAAYRALTESAQASAGERLLRAAAEIAANLGTSTARMEAELAALASEPALLDFFRGPDAAAAGAALSLLESGSSSANVLGTELRDASGRRLLGAAQLLPPAGSLPLPPSEPRAGQASIGPLLAGTGDTVTYATSAWIPDGGDGAGYLVRWRRLSTTDVTRELISDLIGSEARIYLANAEGDVWTDLRSPVPAPAVGTIETGLDRRRRAGGGEALVAAAEVPGAPWRVVVELPIELVMAGPREELRWLFLSGLVLLMTAGGIGWVATGRLTRSISELAEGADAISSGDYSHRATVTRDDEVGRLAEAFNTMAESVAGTRHLLEHKVEELAASEAESRATRERMEHLIASSGAILYTYRVDRPGAPLEWVSENIEDLLGYDTAEAMKPGWRRGILHPDDAEAARVARDRLRREGRATQELRILNADGEYRWVRDDQRLLRDGSGADGEVVGILSDITEHRHMEVARAAAEAASRAKSDFLSRMSHELRTPLNAVLGFGQLLRLDTTSPEDRDNVEQILKAGEHLLALIDEVLDIARIEAGQMSLSVEPVSVAAVLRESVDLVRLTASERDIAIHTGDAFASTDHIRADKQRLKQVLLNLLSNAIKYNRVRGSITVTVEAAPDDTIRIAVADTGFGIAPAKLDRLFTPFERLGAEQKGVEGTGLGLALSRGLVEAMRGRLEVESVEGKGSRFWVELPRGEPPELGDEPMELTPASAPAVPGEPTHCVLFVEDNLANVRLMEGIFRRRPSVRLLVAMQGSMALDLAREHRPDLILLDLNLPDMGGDRVLLQIRNDPELRDTPVIMVSGDAIPSKVERVLELGARAYISKPFDIQELLSTVDRTLDGADV